MLTIRIERVRHCQIDRVQDDYSNVLGYSLI